MHVVEGNEMEIKRILKAWESSSRNLLKEYENKNEYMKIRQKQAYSIYTTNYNVKNTEGGHRCWKPLGRKLNEYADIELSKYQGGFRYNLSPNSFPGENTNHLWWI